MGAQPSNSGWSTSKAVPASQAFPEENILSSWKDIAGYLGKSVRTVQRYEQELGLPVRRPRGSRYIVFAYPSELNKWLTMSSARLQTR